MLYLADTILPITLPPLVAGSGAVRVEAGQISAVGSRSELGVKAGEEITDLGAATLLPGLINAHCHLDYTCLRGSIGAPQSFTAWIRTINALRRSLAPQDYIDSIATGFELSVANGITTIANIESLPEILPQLPVPPLRTWWFLELIDVRTRLDQEATLLGALSFFDSHPEWRGGFGLSPHAPYTASIDLYRLARQCGQQHNMLWTTHIAESVEEHEMFLHARGPLYEFMASLGRDNSDCGFGSSLSHLIEHGVLDRHAIIAHLNYLQDYDYELISQTEASVVHCPKCHTYFGHAPFPYKALREAGTNLCLGTDSLASNSHLDLRAEMREMRRNHEISDQELVEMATVRGAQALGQKGRLGELTPGAIADLIALPHEPTGQPILPYQRVVESQSAPILVLLEGEPVFRGAS